MCLNQWWDPGVPSLTQTSLYCTGCSLSNHSTLEGFDRDITTNNRGGSLSPWKWLSSSVPSSWGKTLARLSSIPHFSPLKLLSASLVHLKQILNRPVVSLEVWKNNLKKTTNLLDRGEKESIKSKINQTAAPCNKLNTVSIIYVIIKLKFYWKHKFILKIIIKCSHYLKLCCYGPAENAY